MITLRQMFIATTLIALSMLIKINGHIVVIEWWSLAYHNCVKDGMLKDWWEMTFILVIGYVIILLGLTCVIDTIIEEITE